MPQVINTNIASLTAQRNLDSSQADGLQAMARLSSGLRINSARDDAAGLAIATRFSAQVRGLDVAMRNANDGISLAQTAEGALGAMTESLQRLRELALQASNATNSDSDRQALNAEADQLIAEITRISEQTNFNGRNLLDGTFASSVQIGTNAGETVDIEISQVTADKLGGGIGAGVSAIGTDAALGNGDLIINGVAIGASAAGDDTASVQDGEQSAIAKAAAINAVSEKTNVIAQVNTNTVGGAEMTAAGTTGTLTLNGVAINITTGGDSAAADRANVVAAINASSERTGVVAVDTGSDTAGVVLEAADGRNITVTNETGSTLTQAATGLAIDDTAGNTVNFTGGFTLVSQDGSNIVIDGGDGSTATGDLANSGLAVGTFGGTTASVVSQSSTGANALAAGDLVINGVSIDAASATDDTASSANGAGSAIATAAAINRSSDQTGVSASVNATSVIGTQTDDAAGETATITLNGVDLSAITTTADSAADRTTAIDAINAVSGRTGVTASDNGTSISLAAEDGRNITIEVVEGGGGGAAAHIGLGGLVAETTTTATVTLSSAGEFTVEAGVNGDDEVVAAGFEQGKFGGATDGQFLTELDISTVEGAERALSAVDNALDSVNAERANLGAIQNRLDSTISSLAINSENLSSARSRILDADFARETAELSRTQVLQQAGISILAQANAQPQLVLSLLQ